MRSAAIQCCKLMSTTWTLLLYKSFCSQISNIVSDEICGLHEPKRKDSCSKITTNQCLC